jgi:hypothetical protein
MMLPQLMILLPLQMVIARNLTSAERNSLKRIASSSKQISVLSVEISAFIIIIL